jgi:GTPase SAR1 family protein
MGGAISVKCLFIGLEGSGKTSILNYLVSGPDQADPSPTRSFNNTDVKFKGNFHFIEF